MVVEKEVVCVTDGSQWPRNKISLLGRHCQESVLLASAIMGKLNIAHHKSYHPYRRDNIERVRRDEEEAQQKEAREEGRMMLAVCISMPFAPSDLRIMSRILKLG